MELTMTTSASLVGGPVLQAAVGSAIMQPTARAAGRSGA
jgi:hypothetical protein